MAARFPAVAVRVSVAAPGEDDRNLRGPVRSVVYVEASEPIDDITAYYVINSVPGATASVGYSAFHVATGVWRVRSVHQLRSLRDVIVGYTVVRNGRKAQRFQWNGFDCEYDWAAPGADGSHLNALHQIKTASLSGIGPEQESEARHPFGFGKAESERGGTIGAGD